MIFVLTLLIIVAFISWMYIFNIYEVDINVENKILSLGKTNNSLIEIIPLNSFGFKTPFRSIDTSVKILEGGELASIIEEDEGNFSVHSKSDTGKVIMLLESDYFLYPNKLTFFIKPSEAS